MRNGRYERCRVTKRVVSEENQEKEHHYCALILNRDGRSAVWTYDQQLVIWKLEGRERDAPLLGTRDIDERIGRRGLRSGK
ncbi:hypothetical protein PILCRDRAFT_829602 [Piloderma croceum F 1598]|uniref:Uncharacterized protein n=1 Tax=Piloderma croceum (strain F 1598) TaxID=765440 RepID=A0A0C3EXN2_PILCF|nr:hypothetical protein PILCRDRAFT_829602 [Piloderma croceum F 1598]